MKTEQVGPERLTPVIDVLCRAFYDDPVVRTYWPDDAIRQKRMRPFFIGWYRMMQDRKLFFLTAGGEAASIWSPPGEYKASFIDTYVRFLPTSLRTRPSIKAVRRFEYMERLHPEEPHWYLDSVGTVPERQGKGYGAAVMEPMLERADAEGLPVWAWSSNQRNLAFYHRLGFEVLDTIEFLPGGPLVSPIYRRPH